jgi:hypothetical protein
LRFVEAAVVHHDAIRQGGDLPAWKYYYEARNMLYYHWHIRHRMGRYGRNLVRLVGRAVFRQRRHRLRCLAAVGRGLFDGAFGRLGIRYPVVPLRERDLVVRPLRPDPAAAPSNGTLASGPSGTLGVTLPPTGSEESPERGVEPIRE